MKKRKIFLVTGIVLIAIFVFATSRVVKVFYDYKKADEAHAEILDNYVVPNSEPSTPQETESGSPKPTEPEEIPEETREKAPVTIDFETLLENNRDVVGWLYCPDTVIHYPVARGKDNDYYLHRGLDGNYLYCGTLFADYRNGEPGEDANYIIYGHSMRNGTMFGTLANYKQQAYYDQHPVMYYLTPNGNYKLELFAGLVVKHNDRAYLPKQSKEEFFQLLQDYKAKSTFQSDVVPEHTDTIVTLSTCSYEFDNARYLVIGRLVPL